MEIKIAIKYKNAFIKNAIILEISKIKNAKRRKKMFKRKIKRLLMISKTSKIVSKIISKME